MSTPQEQIRDPRFVAVIDLIGRTGAKAWTIRMDPGDEEREPGEPRLVAWNCIADYGEGRWDVAGAPEPLHAALRLAEQLIDGGTCVHCGRVTAFVPEREAPRFTMLDGIGCVLTWDEATSRYVRGCEREPVTRERSAEDARRYHRSREMVAQMRDHLSDVAEDPSKLDPEKLMAVATFLDHELRVAAVMEEHSP